MFAYTLGMRTEARLSRKRCFLKKIAAGLSAGVPHDGHHALAPADRRHGGAEPWSGSLTANPGPRLTVPDSLTALTALSLTV